MSKCECKNCVHEKVCRIREFPSIEEILKDGCNHYKDKSLIVELPCRCKDCVNFSHRKDCISYDGLCTVWFRHTEADNFCKFAEKSKDGEGK